MATYVIGDVHGCFDELMELINRIEEEDDNARFILLGDLIDRGPKIYETIQWAMENIKKGGKFQIVLGNHEYMVIGWYHGIYLPYVNGESSYLEGTRYHFEETIYRYHLTAEQVGEIVSFFESWPLYLDVTSDNKIPYKIVHAWAPDKEEEPELSLEKLKRMYVWERDRGYVGTFKDEKNSILIHGHTPTQIDEFDQGLRVPGTIWYGEDSINIDCGCVFRMSEQEESANLAAIRLEDLTEYYVYPLCNTIRRLRTKSVKCKERMLKRIQTRQE